MKYKNFGSGITWQSTNHWILIPTLELKFWHDKYFTKNSVSIHILFLGLDIFIGHFKLKDEVQNC